jgi:hypothetical protein
MATEAFSKLAVGAAMKGLKKEYPYHRASGKEQTMI